MIKYYKNDNCEFVLEMHENRIILSNPVIQPFNEFHYESEKDILHFYYDMRIETCPNYYAVKNVKETKPNWVLTAAESVYEFGIMPFLAEFIDTMIQNVDPDLYGKKVYFRTDINENDEANYRTSYTEECGDILREDEYVITKRHIHYDDFNKKGEYDKYEYDLYIGIGSGIRNNTTGFRVTELSGEELYVVKEWALSFMDYTREQTQKGIELRFESEQNENDSDPAWLKKHMEKNYPDDFKKWRKIWVELYSFNFIRNEYWRFVKGEEIREPLFSKWKGEKVIAQDLIKNGMKDWEAYLRLVDFYKNH